MIYRLLSHADDFGEKEGEAEAVDFYRFQTAGKKPVLEKDV